MNKIREVIMGILNLFKATSFQEATGIKTCVSNEMLNAIKLWNDMSKDQSPWQAKSCGVTAQIATQLNMFIVRELGIETESKTIERPIKHINENISTIVEHIVLTGASLVRPIFSNNKLQYEAIPLGNYLPTEYDFDGTLKGAVILTEIKKEKDSFLLIEKHRYDGTSHSVESFLYKNSNGILRKTGLGAIPETENITPFYEWKGVKFPMIVEFRNQAVNKIDGSKVPVAVIAGAEGLIKDADEQYERMIWEQKGGEMKVFADRDYFRRRTNRDGTTDKRELTQDLSRLIVQIDGDGDGKKITEHTPALRTEQQNEMLQQIFRRIEMTCGLGKGTISDVESVQMTATQYTGGRLVLFSLVDKIEDEIEAKLHYVAQVFAYMATAYGLGSYDDRIVITWNDDTTRKDIIQAKQISMQEISAGVKDKWEHRRDFYGEDEAKAKAGVPEIPVSSFGFM